jgi:hypothetical protein
MLTKERIMTDHDIFAAVRELQQASDRLAKTVRTVFPQMAATLRNLAARVGGDGPGQAFARAYVGESTTPMRELLPALHRYLLALDDHALEETDPEEPSAAETSIRFKRFKKLKEFSVVERAIEVVAPLRDQKGLGILRLEALRSPGEPGYMVAVYRQMNGLLQSDEDDLEKPAKKPALVCLWAQYDLIHSVLPTADKALEQVLGFLEMRCD